MENKQLKYEIPRNVKAGGLFLRLNLKGWIYLTAISSFFSIITWSINGSSIWTAIISGFVVLFTYFSLEIDEKTGESNVQATLQLISTIVSKGKVLTPKWGGMKHDETKKVIHIDVKEGK